MTEQQAKYGAPPEQTSKVARGAPGTHAGTPPSKPAPTVPGEKKKDS
jgi:hypothetical protein